MRLNIHIPVVLLLVLASIAGLSAKPWTVPVRVESSRPPANLRIGDEVTTQIEFHATADLERLEVEIAPFMGVQLLSEPARAVFTNVKKGDAPQLEVRVRITSATIASLGVTLKTVSFRKNSAGALTIEYL
jgi:hypothetical protein